MPIIQAKCPKCLSFIKIDSERDAVLCPNCHEAISSELAISAFEEAFNEMLNREDASNVKVSKPLSFEEICPAEDETEEKWEDFESIEEQEDDEELPEMVSSCRFCGSPIYEGDLFCMECGKSISIEEIQQEIIDSDDEEDELLTEVGKCPCCGTPYYEGDCFCIECGQSVFIPEFGLENSTEPSIQNEKKSVPLTEETVIEEADVPEEVCVSSDNQTVEKQNKKFQGKKKLWLVPVILGGALLLTYFGLFFFSPCDEYLVVREATCTEDGLGKWVNGWGNGKKEVIPAKGHSFSGYTTKSPSTCTQEGVSERKCTVCGKIEQQVIEAKGHDYHIVTKTATCVEEGSQCEKCSRCGDKKNMQSIAALGHAWEEASCTEAKHCSRCGATEGTNLGHNYVNWVCTRCQQAYTSEGLNIVGGVLKGIGSCTDTEIVIPNGVTSIGEYAFLNCRSLTSITIPNGVTSIGEYAFQNCRSLTSITIPNSVTSIGDYAFSWCSSLKKITIPNGVTSIGSSAFDGCSGLKSITIPNRVTSIAAFAFCDCSSLTSITIPNGVTSIGGAAFYGCSGLTNITLPDSVTSIGESAFWDCSSLTSITIPNRVTIIGGAAFRYCSGLTSITIPNGVTSIGEYAFRDCSSLTSITIPNSVTSIGNEAFMCCWSLTSIQYQGTEAQWNAIVKGEWAIPDRVKIYYNN